jgi:hypothetical protein
MLDFSSFLRAEEAIYLSKSRGKKGQNRVKTCLLLRYEATVLTGIYKEPRRATESHGEPWALLDVDGSCKVATMSLTFTVDIRVEILRRLNTWPGGLGGLGGRGHTILTRDG